MALSATEPAMKLTNFPAENIMPTPAAVAAATPQFNLPRNRPTPTENIAIVAILLST